MSSESRARNQTQGFLTAKPLGHHASYTPSTDGVTGQDVVAGEQTKGPPQSVCEFTERTCTQEPQGQTTVGTAPLLVPPLRHKGLASLGPECRL